MVVKIPVYTMINQVEIALDVDLDEEGWREVKWKHFNTDLTRAVVRELENQLGFYRHQIQVFNSDGNPIHDALGTPHWMREHYGQMGFNLEKAMEGVLVVFL